MELDDILKLPMSSNDAKAVDVNDYLKKLLLLLWEEQDSFSGKYAFGNSDWDWDLLRPLVVAGIIKCEYEEHPCGWVDILDINSEEREKFHNIIKNLIVRVFDR